MFAMGQPVQDTTFLEKSVLNAEKAYHMGINKQLNLYNGRGHKTLPLTIEQHPYFLSDDWLMGSIVYESDLYTEIPLQYDLTSEIVITEHPYNGAKMELVNSKITRFEIDQHTFVKLSNNKTEVSDTFYEVLHDGKLKLYAHRKKDLQKRIEGNTLSNEYDEKTKYVMLHENQYYYVTGKKSVITALGNNTNLPKPPKLKVESSTTNKTEYKLISLLKFYDSHISNL
jgi:hypothetical protein